MSIKLSLPLNIKPEIQKYGSFEPFYVGVGNIICVLNMPKDKSFFRKIIDNMSNLGWKWNSGDALHKLYKSCEFDYLLLSTKGRCLKCAQNMCIGCYNNSKCLPVRIDILEKPETKPKPKLNNCLYTIPSWCNVENNCSKCGMRMELLLNSMYCPNCD